MPIFVGQCFELETTDIKGLIWYFCIKLYLFVISQMYEGGHCVCIVCRVTEYVGLWQKNGLVRTGIMVCSTKYML